MFTLVEGLGWEMVVFGCQVIGKSHLTTTSTTAFHQKRFLIIAVCLLSIFTIFAGMAQLGGGYPIAERRHYYN
jgi:hypothetical protein